MSFSKKLEIVPKETKLEVLRRKFGEQYDLMKQYERFQRCNQDEHMRRNVNIGVCPVCGKQIEEWEKMNLHHMAYDCNCIYSKVNCENCEKQNKEKFEECRSKLVYMHEKCHSSIHGFDLEEKGE